MKYEKGIALPITLFVLVGILLAASALIRASEFTIGLSGNVAHRSLAANASDNAIATASSWLVANKASLVNDDAGQGYYSSAPNNPIDYTNPDSWVGARTLPVDAYGNTSSYIIQRMCTQPNTPYNGNNAGIPNVCAVKQINSNANSGNSSGFGAYQYSTIPQLYYKVIVRTVGPRSAESISASMISLSI